MQELKKKNFLYNCIIFAIVFSVVYTIFTIDKVNAGSPEEAQIIYKVAWNTLNQKFYPNNLALSEWGNKFDSKIKTRKDAHKYITNLIKHLNDPYTKFLTEEQLNAEKEIISSKLTGIGIKLANHNPTVLNVLPKSPAARAGIKPKDIIIAIDNKKTKDLTLQEVTKLLKGPSGSEVNIELKRKNEKLKKIITREKIKFEPLFSKQLENDIGYIKIESFISDNTTEKFKNELLKLSAKNGLIIDLRNNTGGLFKSAVEIADSLLSEGKIVTTISKKDRLNEYANSSKIYDGKIVVLVNDLSASASEILAASLQENNRCIVIGEKTFGKGLVQEVVELPDRSGMHVTIAEYVSPKGHKINQIGVIPNIYSSDEYEQFRLALNAFK